MPKSINPIKKANIKKSLLQGKSARKALLEANYSEATAKNATSMTVVKQGVQEILQEISESDITLKMIINNINEDRALAKQKKDISTMHQCDISLSKLMGYWTEKAEIKNTTREEERTEILSRYAHN